MTVWFWIRAQWTGRGGGGGDKSQTGGGKRGRRRGDRAGNVNQVKSGKINGGISKARGADRER